jgi:hypothetical protein
MLNYITEFPGLKVIVLFQFIDATEYYVHGWTHDSDLAHPQVLLEEERAYLDTNALKTTFYVEASPGKQ